MINFIKTHYKNWKFYLRIVLISFLPILTAVGVTGTDITDWNTLGNLLFRFVSNPYLIGLYAYTLYQSFQTTKNKTIQESEVSNG